MKPPTKPKLDKPVSFKIPAQKFELSQLTAKPRAIVTHPVARKLVLPLVCLILGFGGGYLGAIVHTPKADSPTVQAQYVSSQSQLIAKIAQTVGPSVVSVEATSSVAEPSFFGFSQQQSSSQSQGTGIIISSSGLILTNRHVVPAGSSVSVILADGTQYNNVQLVGETSTDDPLDVAFLKIPNLNGKKLTPATLGDSSQMQVGDMVVAIGNALGQFQNTVTSGIISGYGRDVTAADSTGVSSENLTDLFQTDAAINEGNSGGPLVNTSSEVIGLNTATASGAENIGFAIPINDIKGLINGVLKSGKLVQPYLGVRYTSITADIAQQYNLGVTQGAYVIPSNLSGEPGVVSGSPADKAGVREGDIITKVNGTAINQTTSLSSLIDQASIGQTISLTVIRNGQTLTLRATLTNSPS